MQTTRTQGAPTKPFERGLDIAARMRAGWMPTAAKLIEDYTLSRATAYRMMSRLREHETKRRPATCAQAR